MVTIFEQDKFPVYVDPKKNTITCQDFCAQCCIDIRQCENCKPVIIRLAKVKEILENHELYYDIDIYELDYYAKDFIDDILYELNFLYEDFEVNSEIASHNEIITSCIKHLQSIEIDNEKIGFV